MPVAIVAVITVCRTVGIGPVGVVIAITAGRRWFSRPNTQAHSEHRDCGVFCKIQDGSPHLSLASWQTLTRQNVGGWEPDFEACLG
jgi:hypothetical protein